MPNEHALLSASSAERWMKCTASPRFEAQFPETTSEYAEEGRLAHSFAELKTIKKFTLAINQRTYSTRLNKLKKESQTSAEMDSMTDAYIEHLVEKAMTYASPPLVEAEVRVDLTAYIPDGFGTCDCVMIGGDTLNITDFKYGKGVPVAAQGNVQMRLYALGALKNYEPFFGGIIKNVCMTIDQPRVQDEPDSETITVEELLKWGNMVKPIAEVAYSGFGEFKAGEHCRFCRGKAQCKARSEQNIELECFKDLQLPDDSRNVPKNANVLTNAEIADLLIRGKALAAWYADLEEYALKAVLNGDDIPGFKAVAGTSRRKWVDQDAAIKAIIEAGYAKAVVYKPQEPLTLAELEKLMGKDVFREKVGQYVIKPLGKPTLVTLSDKREPYSTVEAVFGNEVNPSSTPEQQ